MIIEVEIFVGIDPSINSTGICILYYEGKEKLKEEFYIVKPKLTKKEEKAAEELSDFDFRLYNKLDLSEYNENNHLHEYYKTCNMVELVNTIKDTVNNIHVLGINHTNNVYIVMEGISYGSVTRTKAVFDLAGLNYMIRQKLINVENITLRICPPSEIKKFATGNGNCPKEAIIELFKSGHSKFMILKKIDDIADAYFMAEYSKKLYNDENEER